MIEETNNSGDDSKVLEDIATYGWHVVMIEATEYLPGFAYTVGLWNNYKHPELISFGLSTQTLHSILNIGGDIAKSGQQLLTDRNYDDFLESSSAQFLIVDKRNIADYFGYAIWFYDQTNFPALQLVWTDRHNKFPWERDYEKEFQHRQPLLDRNADFKFREERNLAVFTTRQFIEEKKPILRVVYDHDGDWQFLTGDQFPEDGKIVSLNTMIQADATLNDNFNLDYGEYANRKFIGDNWERGECEPET